MKIKKSNLMTKIAFGLLLPGIAYKFVTAISTHLSGSTSTARFGILSFVMPIVFIMAILIFLIKRKLDNKFFITAFLLCVYEIVITILSMNYTLYSLPMTFINMTYWLVTIYVTYQYKIEHPDEHFIKNFVVLLFVACLPLYFISISTASSYTRFANRDILVNSIYYLIFLLPFLFIIEKPIIRTACLVAVGAATLISNKRTALLAYAICIILWVLFGNNGKTLKKKFRTIFFLLVGGIAAYYVFNYMMTAFNVSLFERFQEFMNGSDNGSGRFSIWKATIETIQNENILKGLFGRGYRAVSVGNYPISESHNDYIQVLFDYGVVGFIVLIVLIIQLFKVFFQMKRNGYDKAVPYMISVVVFLICSMVSQVLIYPYWFLGVCLFWGYIFADYKNKQRT